MLSSSELLLMIPSVLEIWILHSYKAGKLLRSRLPDPFILESVLKKEVSYIIWDMVKVGEAQLGWVEQGLK